MPELEEEFLRWSWNEAYIIYRCDTASWCIRYSCEKRWALFLLPFSDYKRSDASLYFIITNFHTEHKPQEKFAMAWFLRICAIHNVSMNMDNIIGKPYCFDLVRIKIKSDKFFKQFRWFALKYLFGLHTIGWVLLVLLSELGALPPLPLAARLHFWCWI